MTLSQGFQHAASKGMPYDNPLHYRHPQLPRASLTLLARGGGERLCVRLRPDRRQAGRRPDGLITRDRRHHHARADPAGVSECTGDS